VALATEELLDRARQQILLPTLAELDRRGSPFRGILYAGLMIAPDGSLSVVEFNCRLGDPETQVVLPLVSGGLTEAFRAAAEGGPLPTLETTAEAAVTTVLAARHYPDTPEKGAAITIPADLDPRVTVYHAGTRLEADGTLRVNGGRVLAVTAVAPTFAEAQRLSREAAERIEFDGKQYRRDIGWREAARLGA
jgi:phosphoribosylamine--glycine ligase